MVLVPKVDKLSRCALLLYELSFSYGSNRALRVMFLQHCAPARTPGLLKGPWGLVKRPQTMKSIKIYHVTKPVLQLCSVLSISMDMGLSLVASLTPELCYSSSASNSDSTILSISCLKPSLATYMFASRRACSSPVRIITLRALLLIRKQ